MASMKDIAKKCGLSVATVSKALSGHKDIGSTTAAQLIRLIEHPGEAAPEQIIISGELVKGATIQDLNN